MHNNLATRTSGSGSQVYDVVGNPDRLLVMFDHDHGVAQVTKRLQGLQKPLVVLLVEPHRGLVQNVEHTHETAPDLRGQVNTLRLTTGQRVGRTAECQVAQAHVLEKAKPLLNLFQDWRRNLSV